VSKLLSRVNRFLASRFVPPRRLAVDKQPKASATRVAPQLNATARTGRGFVLDTAAAAHTGIAAPAPAAAEAPSQPASSGKLKLLEDELSKLRAEIAAMMSGDDGGSGSVIPIPPPPPLVDAAVAPVAGHFQLPPPPPPMFDAADAPVGDWTAPPAPPPPSSSSSSTESESVASAGRKRRTTIAAMSPRERAKSVKVAPALRPSETDVQAAASKLKRASQRRSIGGTPFRTPPKERAERRLDEADDGDAPVDTQTMIARALRKKFATLRQQQSPQKPTQPVKKSGGGGVVLGANQRACLGELSGNSLAM
jgi:hypothetical protein